MNNQLVPVFDGTISDESALLCDARELHRSLKVGKTFAAWIKNRIAEYGFIENQDYIAIFQNRKIGHGRGRIDYHLTLDTAKELAMVERNDKGRQIRRYFIDCEKRIHNQVAASPHHIDIADALDNAQNIIDYLKMASLYMEEKIDPAMKAMNCGLFYELHSYVNESRFNARFLHARLSRLQLPAAGKLIK